LKEKTNKNKNGDDQEKKVATNSQKDNKSGSKEKKHFDIKAPIHGLEELPPPQYISSSDNNFTLTSEEIKKLKDELAELRRKGKEPPAPVHPNAPNMIDQPLSSKERKKLEVELDETHKKASEVFKKLRKQMGSKPVKHNEDDVTKLRTHKMKESELLDILIPEYKAYL